MPPVAADLVRVVLLTGARIGEICTMRNGDVDRSGSIWVYRPRSHKNQHRGHTREICCGPRAQLVLRRHLKDDPEAFVFSPREQAELIRQAKRDARKTPVQPSQVDRSMANARRKPGERFNHNSVGVAIRRACRRAGVEAWHVHQLRHLAAQEITRELGAEAARAALGHRSVQMSAHYAGVDRKHAAEVAARVG
jgi:integrase